MNSDAAIPEDDAPIRAELSDAQLAPPIIVAIPPEQERWYVVRTDGSQIGPLAWRDLLGCVRARSVSFSDQAFGESTRRPLPLRQMFPTLAAAELPAIAFMDAMATPAQQFSRGPVSYWFFGPELPPFQKADPFGVHRGPKLIVIAALTALATVLLFCTTLIALRWSVEPSPAISAAGIGWVIHHVGLLLLAGYWLELDFFLSSRKARFARTWFGDQGARTMYICSSSFIVLVSFVVLVFALVMAWQS